MSKTKKLPKYVTYQTLAQFAKAADATFALRLNAMEERLRDEFGASRIIAASDEETGDAKRAGPAPLGESPDQPAPTRTPNYTRPHIEAQFHTEDQQFTVKENGEWVMVDATHEGNHLAPTPAEGEE